MPKPLKKRYVFTATEIARQNAAFFECLQQPEKIVDVFKQAGLPSLAGLYQDLVSKQFDHKAKQKYIDALVRDVYRQAGYSSYLYRIDLAWAKEYLSGNQIYLYSDLNQLLSLLEKEKCSAQALYDATVKTFTDVLAVKGDAFTLWYPNSYLVQLVDPLFIHIFSTARNGHDDQFKTDCLQLVKKLNLALYQANYDDVKIIDLYNLINSNDYKAALAKLDKKTGQDIVRDLLYLLLEAQAKQAFQGLSERILGALQAYQTTIFSFFSRDVHRQGLILYHPNYPKGREIKIGDYNKIITEIDLATQQIIYQSRYQGEPGAAIVSYLKALYKFSNQTIAYLMLNDHQGDVGLLGMYLKTNLEINPDYFFKNKWEYLRVASPNVRAIFDENNQLRTFIKQVVVLHANSYNNENQLLGEANLVHEIPKNSMIGEAPLKSYLPGSFSSVNISIIYEPTSKVAELRYLSDQRFSKRVGNFFVRPLAYFKAHPFKSLLWFTLAAGVTAGLILATPVLINLLLSTSFASIAVVLANFVANFSLLPLVTTPLLMGVSIWWLIATIQGGEDASFTGIVREVENNFVTEKVTEMVTESKIAQAKAQSTAKALGMMPRDKKQEIPVVGESSSSVLCLAGSASSNLFNATQDSGELHPASSDEPMSEKFRIVAS